MVLRSGELSCAPPASARADAPRLHASFHAGVVLPDSDLDVLYSTLDMDGPLHTSRLFLITHPLFLHYFPLFLD